MTRTKYAAYNGDLTSQIEHLTSIILKNPILDSVIRKARELKIDHYYIGAGCITQTIWNHQCGFPVNRGIKDIDFVYYDSDLSYDKECEVIERVKGIFGDLPISVDVKNQARVHLWYEQHFGYADVELKEDVAADKILIETDYCFHRCLVAKYKYSSICRKSID